MANPAVDFRLEILNPQTVAENENSGALDLVSYLKPPGEKVQNQLEVAKDRLVVITPPRHELVWKENVSLDDVLKFPLILYESGPYESGHEMCGLVDSFFASNGVNARGMDVKMRLPDPASVIAAVSEGLGVSLCSEIIARKSERAGLISIIIPYNVKGGHYSIYVKRTASDNEAINNFWDYLEKMSERFKGNLPCMLKILYL
jgi:DNA-binding transcriptional LysR family regulator